MRLILQHIVAQELLSLHKHMHGITWHSLDAQSKFYDRVLQEPVVRRYPPPIGYTSAYE